MSWPDFFSTVALIISGIPVVYFDLKKNTIPNSVTYTGIGIGLVILVLFRRPEFLNYALAFLLGFGLFYVFFLMGWVGGGDVKLMGMVGILMGLDFLIAVFIYTSIAGGAIALCYLAVNLARRKPVRHLKIPYGTAIVAGIYLEFIRKLGGVAF